MTVREQVAHVLRSNTRAELVHDGAAFAGRYVLDPSGPRLVLPVPQDALAADEFVVHVPEDRGGSVQILALLDLIDPDRDAACDRFLAYHGAPHGLRWAAFRAEAFKVDGHVIDGMEVDLGNPLAPAELALLKHLNVSPDRLAAACRRTVGVTPAQPIAVAIDAWGIDVRDRFAILRLPLDPPAPTVAQAEAMLGDILRPREDQ
ncbi:MAG: hypothetical protein H6811_06945 [Phycisphaeraceae bacterium]|nr:hypothetical protein [Phycisphaeraceae bacterium]